MTAISFRAETVNNGNSTSYVDTLPAGLQGQDLLILLLSFGTAGGPVSPPAGWTQKGTDIVNGSQTVRLFWKFAAGSPGGASTDAGAVIGMTATATSKYVMAGLCYPAGAGIGEFEFNTDAAATLNHVTTALTAMAAGGSWAVVAFMERSTTVPTPSWAAPAGMTQRVNNIGTGTSAHSICVADTNGVVTTLAAKTGVSTDATPVKGINIALEILGAASIVAPGAPTTVAATAGDGQATITFVPGSNGGDPSVEFMAISSPGGKTSVLATSGPLVVSGLTNGTVYTFQVEAINAAGNATSTASIGVTPVGTTALFFTTGPLPLIGGPFIAPPPSGPLLGVASPGSTAQGDTAHPVSGFQDGWDTTGGQMSLKLQRSYNTGLPASYAASNAAKIVGPTRRIMSVTPSIAQGLSTGGPLDATVAALAATIPAGVLLTTNHEPEQKGKAILPAAFGNWYVRFTNIVKSVNPAILIGPILMDFTSNGRLVDTLGHATLGHNEWAEAVANAGGTPDWFGIDCYPDGETGSPSGQAALTGPIAIAQTLFPGIHINICEIGFHPGPTRSAKIADSYGFCASIGIVDNFSYFDVNQGVADYILTPAESIAYAGLQV